MQRCFQTYVYLILFEFSTMYWFIGAVEYVNAQTNEHWLDWQQYTGQVFPTVTISRYALDTNDNNDLASKNEHSNPRQFLHPVVVSICTILVLFREKPPLETTTGVNLIKVDHMGQSIESLTTENFQGYKSWASACR